MASDLATFSESWYRVAGQRLYLRPGVRVRRQNFRGERWYVLENPFSNQFFRLRPAAYEFVARLRSDRTVQEVWQECLERFPDEAPGQDAVIQLLSQLYFANLLQYERGTDASQLFARFKKRRQRELAGRLMNLMFMRFPLLDPDRFLLRTLPLVGWLIRPLGAVLWLVVVGLGVKVVIDNFPTLLSQGQGVLAPGNLVLLYLGLVIVKTLHEFGHAYFCRHFGGEVHTMGILLMIFTPVPYMDATSSWGFRSRRQRMLVGAAGMIVEVFVAAVAAMVWANTGPGTVHSLAYNMMFVASVSTVLFNLNPLLRFDGYYILSDLIDIPNLAQRANQQLRYLSERYLFGVKRAESATDRRREAAWLVGFGITSGIYRVIVFTGVLLFVADRFLILGILMAVICLISWVTVPVGKLIHYLATSSRLDRVRARAVLVTLALAGMVLVLLGVIPFPHHFRAPGVLQARQRVIVVNEVAGKVAGLPGVPGLRVEAGQPLVRLENPVLALEIADQEARRVETDARLRDAMSRSIAELRPLQSRLEAITRRLAKLERDRESLVVRAAQSGTWVAPGIREFVGRHLDRGTPLGLIVDDSAFEFVATVAQTDADAAFARAREGAEIRLRGEAGTVIRVPQWTVIPGGKQSLPSPALGWAAGGEVPVTPDEPARAHEPFFEVHAPLSEASTATLIHGRSGRIRFNLAPEPLLPRWMRRLWQLLQQRYQL